jgi:hypothetical protein
MFERVVTLLRELREMLTFAGQHAYTEDIDAALSGDDAALEAFLTSNMLWGGAGSIADSACGDSRETRRPVEQLLARLGREQLRLGYANPRTEMWTSTFEQWHAQHI